MSLVTRYMSRRLWYRAYAVAIASPVRIKPLEALIVRHLNKQLRRAGGS